jgi:predicted acetyltransferase
MKIVRRTNADKDFYVLLGPFLSNRQVEREIGYRIYDDEGKIWFIALDGYTVAGFCYVHEKAASQYHFGSCYVVNEYRRKGIFRNLLKEAIRDIVGTVHLTTNNEAMAALIQKEGFKRVGVKGSFNKFSKEIKNV